MSLMMYRILLMSVYMTSAAIADTWTVDDDGKADFNTIQAAVDAASDGDEIIVMPGTYTSTEDQVVHMGGKAIRLHSDGVLLQPIIDGEGKRRGIFCDDAETNKTIIEGFTIYRCKEGAIYCLNASPMIKDCSIGSLEPDYVNESEHGAGIYCEGSNATMTDCFFYGNVAEKWGGGAYCYDGSDVLFDTCTFTNNQAKNGGGLGIRLNSGGTVLNCTFNLNSAISSGGAIRLYETEVISMSGCNFSDNQADVGGAIRVLNCPMEFEIGVEGITMNGCQFVNNTARVGGGISSSCSLVSVTSCSFEENLATDEDLGGGAINCTGSECWDIPDNYGDVDIQASIFCGNEPFDLAIQNCGWSEGSWFYEQCAQGCNGSVVQDFWDIYGGTSEDCNSNNVPDECDIDCNENDTPDECDIENGTSNDLNQNGIPDECELQDCNENGIDDAIDIKSGTSQDCNFDDIPDDCQLEDNDCNGNVIPDDCELADNDCNSNEIPDDCELDCNNDGTPDECEADCNENGIPDECEDFTGDVNSDGFVDVSDILAILGEWGCDDWECPEEDVWEDGVINVNDLLVCLSNLGECQ